MFPFVGVSVRLSLAAKDAEVAEIEFGVSNIFGFFAHFAAEAVVPSGVLRFNLDSGGTQLAPARAEVGTPPRQATLTVVGAAISVKRT